MTISSHFVFEAALHIEIFSKIILIGSNLTRNVLTLSFKFEVDRNSALVCSAIISSQPKSEHIKEMSPTV